MSEITESNQFDNIPDHIVKGIRQAYGDRVLPAIAEMEQIALEHPEYLENAKTFGAWNWSQASGRDYRPESALSFSKIDRIMKSGIALFALMMKFSSAIAPFRDEQGWRIVSPDKELQEITTNALRRVMPRFANDLQASLIYGYAPFEQVWKHRDKYWLGMSSSRNSSLVYSVPGVPRAIKPHRLRYIQRDKNTGQFRGIIVDNAGNEEFLDHRRIPPVLAEKLNKDFDPKLSETDVALHTKESLVLTYNSRYRNLYGESFLEPMYPLWWLYELSIKAMMRFMQRIATPVICVRYPEQGHVRVPVNGQMKQVEAADAAMMLATEAGYSPSIILPTRLDPETKENLWDIFYLKADSGVDIYVKAVEFFEQAIVRAALSADRSLMQSSGGVGSYNIGDVHRSMTLIHSDMILTEWVTEINEFWVRYFGEYNRGTPSPPVYLDVELLDPERKGLLKEIMDSSSSSKAFEDATNDIDYRASFKKMNVPLLSEEEAEEKRKKAEKAAKKAERKPTSTAESAVNRVSNGIANGVKPPTFFSPEQVDELKKTGKFVVQE